jgi:hypothetical protein
MSVSQPAAVLAPAFCLSLHIRHPSLDPAHISRELQLAPEDAFGAGEPRSGAAGVHGETYWAARLEPVFWQATGYLRTFDPRPPVEPAGPVGPLPADRRERFKLLIARGRQQGYLTHAEVRQHLSGDSEPLEEVARTLAGLGIPVHEQSSPALAAIQRLHSVDLSALKEYLGRHPALHLTDVLGLVCLRLSRQHAGFIEQVSTEGGSVRLLVTLSSRAVHGLTLAPALTSCLAQLGVTLELALATGLSRPRSRAS